MKERKIYDCRDGCPVESTIQFISGKWKSVILYHLIKNPTQRFGELNEKIPGCAPRMLARQLVELEQDRLIQKRVYSIAPSVTDYSLTDFGQTLEPVILAMATWGSEYNKSVDKS